jgi:uncharacterized Zn-finger protein
MTMVKGWESDPLIGMIQSDLIELPECEGNSMVGRIVPHFHNDAGAAVIEIGAKEFMCVGAMPPFDHPHVYCDMGDDNEYICPYCSTLYRFDPALDPHAARPPECMLPDLETA